MSSTQHVPQFFHGSPFSISLPTRFEAGVPSVRLCFKVASAGDETSGTPSGHFRCCPDVSQYVPLYPVRPGRGKVAIRPLPQIGAQLLLPFLSVLAIQPRIGVAAVLLAIITRLAVPLFSRSEVLSYAVALFIHEAEEILGISIFFLRSLFEPLLCFLIVLPYTLAEGVHAAEVTLG